MYLLTVWHTENETSLSKINKSDIAKSFDVAEEDASEFINKMINKYDDQQSVAALLEAIICGGKQPDVTSTIPQVFESSDLEYTFVLATTETKAKIALVDFMLSSEGQ